MLFFALWLDTSEGELFHYFSCSSTSSFVYLPSTIKLWFLLFGWILANCKVAPLLFFCLQLYNWYASFLFTLIVSFHDVLLTCFKFFFHHALWFDCLDLLCCCTIIKDHAFGFTLTTYFWIDFFCACDGLHHFCICCTLEGCYRVVFSLNYTLVAHWIKCACLFVMPFQCSS